MAKNKIGIILIAIGICLPLILLVFVSGYKQGAGFISNLFALKIVVSFSEKSCLGIPYRFILAVGIVLVFFGIRSFDMVRARSKRDSDAD